MLKRVAAGLVGVAKQGPDFVGWGVWNGKRGLCFEWRWESLVLMVLEFVLEYVYACDIPGENFVHVG